MNYNNYNQYDNEIITNDYSIERSQGQMPFGPQGFNPQFDQVPPFRPPGYDQPFDQGPTFAPPGFEQQFGQNQQFGYQGYNPISIWPGSSQRVRRCLYRLSYITLFNGNNFWFYPTDIRRQTLVGFRWRRNRWDRDTIELNRIRSIRCR